MEKSAVWPSRSREPKKSVASSVSVVGRPSSDWPELHRSRSGDRKRRSQGSDRCQDSPDMMLLDTTVDDERVSGPVQRLGAGPVPGDRRI